MADLNQKILLQLELDASKLIKQIVEAKDKSELLTKQLQRAKLDLSEAEAAGNTAGASYQNLQRQIAEYEVELRKSNEEQRTASRLLKLSQQANEANEGSLTQQKAILSVLTAQYNELSQEERENTDAGKQLQVQIKGVSDKLKEQEAVIGNARRNVGNYKSAIQEAFTELELSKDKVNDVKFSIDELNKKFSQGDIEEAKFKEQLAALTSELDLSTSKFDELTVKVDDLRNIANTGGEGFKSLRERLKEARDEATKLQDKFTAGLINEQDLISAQQRVADLSEEMGDFQKRIDALNPEAKFKAFTQVASGLAGGIGVVSGAMGLLGGESDQAAQALLKVQQFMQFTQGLNQLAELGDAFKNLRIVLGLTTTAQRAQTVAQAETTAVTEAGAVATTELAAAETAATGTTAGLTVAMGLLASPIVLVAGAIGLIVAGFKIYNAVTADAIENTENLIDASENAVEASKHTTEIRAEAIQKEKDLIQQRIDILQSEGKSEGELLEFKKRANATVQGLQDDTFEANEKNITELRDLENRLAIQSTQQVTEEEKKKVLQKKQSVTEQIRTLEEANEKIILDQQAADNRLIVEENNLKETRLKISEQATALRISVIKNERQREVAQEVESSKERLRQLLKAESENAELILAERTASAQRIKQINLKFDLQEVQERTQVEIESTIEGTERRFQAEIRGAENIRREKLRNETLTENEILQIESDTINKISEIRSRIIQRDSELAEQEINLERQKANTILEIQRAQAQTPNEKAGVDIVQIQSDLQFELELIENTNEEKVKKIENQKQTELQLLRSSSDEKTQSTQEFKDKEKEIITRKDTEIDQVNQFYDNVSLQRVVESGEKTNAAIKASGDERLQNIILQRELELAGLQPGEDILAAKLALIDAEEQAEIASLQNRLGNSEQFENAKTNLTRKYAGIRTSIEREQNRNQLELVSQALGQAASLFKKHTAAYRILASSQALINTYLNATQAYNVGLQAGYPIGIVLGPVLAALAVAQGLVNVAQINGIQFYKGGFTGKGDPRQESTQLGSKPYTYHKEEYVIDHRTLADPVVSGLVHNVIEKKRVNKSLSTTDLLQVSSTAFAPPTFKISSPSFASGGFTPPLFIQNPTTITQPIDMQAFRDTVISGVAEAFANTVIETDVKNIIEQIGIVNKVENRANH